MITNIITKVIKVKTLIVFFLNEDNWKEILKCKERKYFISAIAEEIYTEKCMQLTWCKKNNNKNYITKKTNNKSQNLLKTSNFLITPK